MAWLAGAGAVLGGLGGLMGANAQNKQAKRMYEALASIDVPNFKFPGRSTAETAKLVRMNQLAAQMAKDGTYASDQMRQGQGQFNNLVDMMMTGKDKNLSDYEKQLAQELGNNYYDQAIRGLSEGSGAKNFQSLVRQQVEDMAARGVLDSNVAGSALGDAYSERTRLLADAGTNAANQRIGLETNFLNNNAQKLAALSGTLSQNALGLGGLANQNVQTGAGINQAGLDFATRERYNKFNTDNQNQMQQYQHNLMLASTPRGGASPFGALLGGAVSGGLAGMSMGSMFGANPLKSTTPSVGGSSPGIMNFSSMLPQSGGQNPQSTWASNIGRNFNGFNW